MESPQVEKIKHQVGEIKDFLGHLAIYIMVNSALFFIDLIVDKDSWWFYWSSLIWGVAVIAHAVYVFVIDKYLSDWEEKKIKEMTSKEHKS